MILRNPNRQVPIIEPCKDPMCPCYPTRQRVTIQYTFAEEVVSNDAGEEVRVDEQISAHWDAENQFYGQELILAQEAASLIRKLIGLDLYRAPV